MIKILSVLQSPSGSVSLFAVSLNNKKCYRPFQLHCMMHRHEETLQTTGKIALPVSMIEGTQSTCSSFEK